MILLLSLAATAALPPPMTAEQASRVRCVAALAIVANDQARGAPGGEDVPPLAKRGAHFAGIVGASLTKDKVRSREQVKATMTAAVATFQKAKTLSPETVNQCIALMNRVDPPAPPPSLTQCAATLSLAYEDVAKRDAASNAAKDMATFAAVVTARARAELRDGGKTEAEGDVILGHAKDAIAADAKAGRDTPEIGTCLDYARP